MAGSNRVYVGNLGPYGKKEDLEREFSRFGPIKDVWVARNPPGFAFVVYNDNRDAEQAVREMDGQRLCNVRIKVELSHADDDKGGRRNRGGSDGRDRGPPPRDRGPPPRRGFPSRGPRGGRDFDRGPSDRSFGYPGRERDRGPPSQRPPRYEDNHDSYSRYRDAPPPSMYDKFSDRHGDRYESRYPGPPRAPERYRDSFADRAPDRYQDRYGRSSPPPRRGPPGRGAPPRGPPPRSPPPRRGRSPPPRMWTGGRSRSPFR